MALLRILLMAAVVFFVTRWLRRLIVGSASRPGRGAGSKGGFVARQSQNKSRAKLKMLKFAKPPHLILGVKRDAKPEEIEAAYAAALAKNDPTRLQDMSPEIREVASRRQVEIHSAYRAITGEE